MKKNLLLFVLGFFLTHSSFSQIKKGAHFLGGSLGIQTGKTTSSGGAELKTHSVTIAPAYGKAIKDNLIVGADISLENGAGEDFGTKQETNGYGGGVFIRKYLPLGKGFYLFGQGRLGVNARKIETSQKLPPSIVVDNREFNTTLSFYPGVSYAINKKIHLETAFNNLAYIQYSHVSSEASNIPGKSKGNSFTLGTNLSNLSSFVLGIRFILNS